MITSRKDLKVFATLTLACPSLSQLVAHTSHDDVIAPEQLQEWNIREDNTLRLSALSHTALMSPDSSTPISMMCDGLINQIPLLLAPRPAQIQRNE